MSEIEVVEYRSSWPEEFQAHAAQLKSRLAGHVTRIDHIGSTSVPGLTAKDVLDLQIAVPSLTGNFVTLMTSLGYRHHPNLKDSPPPDADPNEWQKQVFTEPPGPVDSTFTSVATARRTCGRLFCFEIFCARTQRRLPRTVR